MQPLKKTSESDSLDYSFLFSKLEQLSSENAHYRKAFAQITEVAKKVAGGDLSARIANWDGFEKLSPMLAEINNAYDISENYIRESEASQQIALKNQDEFRKEQLQELKEYFKEQMARI